METETVLQELTNKDVLLNLVLIMSFVVGMVNAYLATLYAVEHQSAATDQMKYNVVSDCLNFCGPVTFVKQYTIGEDLSFFTTVII